MFGSKSLIRQVKLNDLKEKFILVILQGINLDLNIHMMLKTFN